VDAKQTGWREVLRADSRSREARLVAGGRRIARARVFSEVLQGEIFWYENSLGLAEIAANGASAAGKLGVQAGKTVEIEPGWAVDGKLGNPPEPVRTVVN
jgi:S-adenosylmethionine hydrolase